jgi:uncharacterized membrane protein
LARIEIVGGLALYLVTTETVATLVKIVTQ